MKRSVVTAALAAGLLLAAPVARAQDYGTQLLENSTENYNNNISVITNGILNPQ